MDVGDDDDKGHFCVDITQPDENATGVAVDSFRAVVITFGADVDPQTVTRNTFTVRDSNGQALEGDVWAGGVTAEFRLPDKVYSSKNTTYTVHLSGSITDIYGRSLAECEGGDFEYSFTTGG